MPLQQQRHCPRVPYALPASAFQRLADNRAHTAAHLVGPVCHTAHPQVVRTGPHAPGAANTDEYRVCAVFVAPPQWSEALVRDHPAGRCALPPFHPTYITPDSAPTDADVQARAAVTKEWWHQACTNNAAGNSFIRITPSVARHAGDQVAPQPTRGPRQRDHAHCCKSGRAWAHHGPLPSRPG